MTRQKLCKASVPSYPESSDRNLNTFKEAQSLFDFAQWLLNRQVDNDKWGEHNFAVVAVRVLSSPHTFILCPWGPRFSRNRNRFEHQSRTGRGFRR